MSFQASSSVGNVMDAFLAHAGSSIYNMSKDLLQVAINMRSVEKSKKKAYEKNFISMAKAYPPQDTTFQMLTSTFSSLGKSDINSSIQSINNLIPILLCERSDLVIKPKSFLTPFPSVISVDSIVGFTTGFIVEVVFSSFAASILENSAYIQPDLQKIILSRIQIILNYEIQSSLQLSLLEILMEKYIPLIKLLSKQNFENFAPFISENFPSNKAPTNYVILFMQFCRGITFNETNYQDIKPTLELIPKLQASFANNNEVSDAICYALCDIIPQMRGFADTKFLAKVESQAYKFLKQKIVWKSSLKLMGVIHYLIPSQMNPKYQKFLESNVFRRLAKPHKVDAALDYMACALRPSKDYKPNWTAQTGQLIRIFYQKIFEANLEGKEIKAAAILESIAALDLPAFVDEWLPELLETEQHACVALIAVQNILNPMSSFQELAKSIPTNASIGVHKLVSKIVTKAKDYIVERFKDPPKHFANIAFYVQPISDIIGKLEVPANASKSNHLTMSSVLLYYLLEWRKFPVISPLPTEKRMLINNSNRSCRTLIQQWMTTFDTPHNSFGNIVQKNELVMLEEGVYRDSVELNVIPIIPILMYYAEDFSVFTQTLLNLMVSVDPCVAGTAAMVYQLLFYAFPSSWSALLNELKQFTIEVMANSVSQFHQLLQVFHYCMAISKNQLVMEPDECFRMADLLAFCGLCSPFPVTHIVSIEILELTRILKHHINPGTTTASLLDVINDSADIEQRMIAMIISEYSTWSESACPIHRMPTISLLNAAYSDFHLLWRFAFVQIIESAVKAKLTQEVLEFRDAFLNLAQILESDTFSEISTYHLEFITNIINALFASSTIPPSTASPQQRKQWIDQGREIDNLVDTATSAILKLDANSVSIFSFVFTALNIGSLAKAISSFLETVQKKNVKLGKKEEALSVFSTMLRHVAMHNEFDDYIAKMLHNGQIKKILQIFDTSLQVFTKIEGVEFYRQTLHSIDLFSHFLVFRGQYFRFLHQSRIETPHCPIPRCAITSTVLNKEISPRIEPRELFELLFKWALMGIDDYKIHEFDAAELVEVNLPDKKQISGFGHAARVALSYLAPLCQIYDDSKYFTTDFLKDCSVIGKQRPAFLKHLLTRHLSFLLGTFSEMALTQEFEIATLFMNAITVQFIPPIVKDSMIYSHNTFLKHISTTGSISEYDTKFVELVYRETGTLLLMTLFFLLHNDVSVRQNAMLMLGQVFPPLSILHYNGDKALPMKFVSIISKSLNEISTQNTELRMKNCEKLSALCSEVFNFATEQLLVKAFASLSSVFLHRKYCNREHLIRIIKPWLKWTKIDLKNRTTMLYPSKFFTAFSSYSLIHSLVMATLHITPFTSSLSLWKAITTESKAPDSNTRFVVIALMEIGVTQPETQSYIRFIFTYIYRLMPNILKILISMLSYGQWYFHHVQLGTFEEIADMTQFLEEVKKGKKAKKSINFRSSRDKYNETTEFALASLKDLAQEDIIPFIQELNIVVAYCMTHLTQKSAFDLLFTIANNLNASFSSGSPECLWNACELLSRINSVQFDVIRFVIDDPDTPLRALQRRVVSSSSLLNLFIRIFAFLPEEPTDSLSIQLLLWGLSCGYLPIAATALNLYSSSFETHDRTIIYHLIESACIVMRCAIQSQVETETISHVASYINSILRTLRMIVSVLARQKELTMYPILFWLAIPVIGSGGPLFPLIVDEAVKLMTTVIRAGVFDQRSSERFDEKAIFDLIENSSSQIKDLKSISLAIALTCTDSVVLIYFLMQITKLPQKILSSDGDFTIYAILFAPFICTGTDSPQALGAICQFSSLHIALSRLGNLFGDTELGKILMMSQKEAIQPSQLIEAIAAISPEPEILFNNAAQLCSAMLHVTPAISIDAIFDLSAAIMDVNPTKEAIIALTPLTNAATTAEDLGDFSHKTNFLQAISKYSEQMILVSEKLSESEFDARWLGSFVFMQSLAETVIHTMFNKPGDIVRIRFDDIASFPPIFPFEEQFLVTPVVDEVSRYCRGIQVNPQTNWSFSLYCAQDVSELRAAEGAVGLEMELPVEAIMEEILDELGNAADGDDEDEEEDPNEVKSKSKDSRRDRVSSHGTGRHKGIGIELNQPFYLVPRNAFLPDESYIEKIVEDAVRPSTIVL